jgi:WD40 repeat protein
VAFSPDGRHFAAVGPDFTIEILDTATGRELYPLKGHRYAIFDMAFSPIAEVPRLASASADGTVRIWDLTTRKEIVDPPLRHANDVRCLAFNGDGQFLASGGHDRLVKVWDGRSWKQLYELPDSTDGVECMAFHPKDSRVLAWGGTDSTIKIWNGATRVIRTLRGHLRWALSVAFSPDGKWIASGSLDGTVKIWKVPPLGESNGATNK